MCTLSVILPTYNERGNIGPLIDAVLAAGPERTEVIVVDDDSPDGTWEVVAEKAAADPRVRLIRRVGVKGLTSAFRDGVAASRGRFIAWMDSDRSQPPALLPALMDAAADAGVAAASRYVPGGRDARNEKLAVGFSCVINRLARIFLGDQITDYTTGYVCCRREVLERIDLRGDYGEYCIDLLHRARRAGFQVVELPYVFISRSQGESKTATSLFGFARRGWRYLATIARLALFH